MAEFKPGPYKAGDEVTVNGVIWVARKDIKYATALPKAGTYWMLKPEPVIDKDAIILSLNTQLKESSDLLNLVVTERIKQLIQPPITLRMLGHLIYQQSKEPPVQPNTPPTANAGTGGEITLPVSSVQANGSGTDKEGPVTFSWKQLIGPKPATISNPVIANPVFSDMTMAGTYSFELTVTDTGGLKATSTVIYTVLAEPEPVVYWKSTFELVPDNTYAPDVANPNRAKIPSLKNTSWNIYTDAGDVWCRKETVNGRAAMRCHAGANIKRAADNSVRAELEPDYGRLFPGDVYYFGFDYWNAPVTQRPAWNLAFQLKGEVGGPSLGLYGNDQAHGVQPGIVAADAAFTTFEQIIADSTTPKRIVLGFERITKGRVIPGSKVSVWVDGSLIFTKENWLSSNNQGGLGGLIFSDNGTTGAYLKFGLYGAIATQNRDQYYANMILASTYEAAQGDFSYPEAIALPDYTDYEVTDFASPGTPVALKTSIAAIPTQITNLRITGSPLVGQTLTAATDSVGSYAYQWIRSDANGENPAFIEGQTNSTYALVAGDIGFRFMVQATNSEGLTVTSLKTQTVEAVKIWVSENATFNTTGYVFRSTKGILGNGKIQMKLTSPNELSGLIGAEQGTYYPQSASETEFIFSLHDSEKGKAFVERPRLQANVFEAKGDKLPTYFWEVHQEVLTSTTSRITYRFKKLENDLAVTLWESKLKGNPNIPLYFVAYLAPNQDVSNVKLWAESGKIVNVS